MRVGRDQGSRPRRPGTGRAARAGRRRPPWRARAARARRGRSRPSPSRGRAVGSARGRLTADRRAPAGSHPRRARRASRTACFSRRSPFGVITHERARRGVERLAAQQMEVLGRGRAVGDADVLLGRELEEALELGARVLRPVALVAVRQEEGQPRGLLPLREARDEELVDHDLGAVRRSRRTAPPRGRASRARRPSSRTRSRAQAYSESGEL